MMRAATPHRSGFSLVTLLERLISMHTVDNRPCFGIKMNPVISCQMFAAILGDLDCIYRALLVTDLEWLGSFN